MKQRWMLLAVSLMPIAPRGLPAQAADTVRLKPVNVLVTMPSGHTSGRRWIGRDSALRDGRPTTFLKREDVYYGERPELFFYWLYEPDCNTWKRHMNSIEGAHGAEEIRARVEEMRIENQQTMARAGVVESLPPAPTTFASENRDQSPEDYFSGLQAFTAMKLGERPSWSRGDGWSDVYELQEMWETSCFEGARRPLVVVFPFGSPDYDGEVFARRNAYIRDVLNAVGRAARRQYPRR